MQKHYRLTFDVNVTITDMTPEAIRQDLDRYRNKAELLQDPATWEMADREKRLLEAFLRNPPLVETWRRGLVASEVAFLDENDLYQALGLGECPPGEEDLLQPVLDTLGEDDAAWFQTVRDRDLFSENTEHFRNRIQATVEQITLEELPA